VALDCHCRPVSLRGRRAPPSRPTSFATDRHRRRWGIPDMSLFAFARRDSRRLTPDDRDLGDPPWRQARRPGVGEVWS
jgi:hypothetical protein